MPVNVAAHLRAGQKLHVIRTRQQTHVINLRNTGDEELDCAGDQVFVSAAPEGVEESAIHLIQVKVVGGCARSLPALVVAARVDRFYQLVDFVRSKEAGFAFAVRAHINNADAIMGIEYGDGITRSNCEPMGKGPGVARKKRMEDERREREIINPIDLARDFHLLQIVTVNFDQDFHPKPMGLLRERLQ